MSRASTAARYVALGILGILGIILVLLVILSRTDFGGERVRQFSLDLLEDRIAGEARLERISSEGSLFGGVTLHDFSLVTADGRPFLSADSAILEYDWRTFLGGDIVFDRVDLYAPDIVIERLPGDERWNYDRALASPGDGADGGGERGLILLEAFRIHNGQVALRMPWEPSSDEPVEPEDTARILLEDAPGGMFRVMRFENVNVDVATLLAQTPEEPGSLFEIADLSTRAFVWREPMEVENLRGTVTIRDSILAFDAEVLELPETRATVLGRVILGDESLGVDILVDGERVALRDIQWLYPGLPEEGGGRLVFRMQSRGPGTTLWYAEDMEITTPGTSMSGSLGLVTGDSLYFTRVDLRASPLDVQFLESILPIDLPVEGLMVNTVEVEGPID